MIFKLMLYLLLASFFYSQNGKVFNTMLVRTQHMYIADAKVFKPSNDYSEQIDDNGVNFRRRFYELHLGNAVGDYSYSLGFIYQQAYRTDNSIFQHPGYVEKYGDKTQDGLTLAIHGSYRLGSYIRLTIDSKIGLLNEKK